MPVRARDSEQVWDRVLLLRDRGRMADAEELCDAILRDDPENAEVLHTKGVFAAEAGRWRRASYYFRKAACIPPGEPRYYLSLSISLWSMGRLCDALAATERGLRVFPHNADLLMHRARFLVQNEDAQGLQYPERDIPVPSDPVSLLERAASIAEDNGQLSDGARFWTELLRLVPRHYAALNNLARIRSAQGRITEALNLYKRAVKLPETPGAVGSNLLLTLLYDVRATPAQIFEEHRAWAARIGERPRPKPRAPAVRRSKLRVGYVSGDFRLHAVAYFAESVFQKHDPARVEIHCFSNASQSDRVTSRFRRMAAGWRQIDQMSDDEAAESIRRAKIDILVDMSGHSSNNRLPLFARKPAPIQVGYLGYQATSGLRAIDYRFTDSIADPPGRTEHLHTETLVRLDPCFQCYRPLLARMPVSPLPQERCGYVTLACFAIRQKFSDPLLEAWAEILRRSRGARLLLKCYTFADPDVRREMEEFFRHRGVSKTRLELLSPTPTMRAHLESYRHADLMLDTYPYNGATMTCEALWRGVPTVTWAGPTFVSRMGASLLSQVGLQCLIATSAPDYVNKTLEAIADLPRLADWRRRMRQVMRASPLMDANRLTRQIEKAYFQMWRN